MNRMRKRFLDCSKMTIEEAESYGRGLAEQQRDVMWQIADLARFAEAKWPDTHYQVWPDWVSPGMIARASGVGKAYPNESDRATDATFTIYMRESNRSDRIQRVQAHVEAGRTSDEAAKVNSDDGVSRWLLAVDVHYYLHRFWFGGAGIEAAMGVSSWVARTVERLKEKGLTDVVCCFDSKTNHRKELVIGAGWEDKYKDRPPKDPELGNQLSLVYQLLEGAGFCCAKIDGMEADDIMASCANQFDGKVTILTQDKDARQCLSDKCNMLLDVEWSEDETTGDNIPDYKWLSAKQHTEATGIRPDQWTEFQAIMGDNVDGIKGCVGIGEKGANDLIKEFGSAGGAIQAAKDEAESIKPKKRDSLIEFESKLEVTLQLVTLRTDLKLPSTTRI